MQGRIQDFKLGGAHLKKLRQAEGGGVHAGCAPPHGMCVCAWYHIWSRYQENSRQKFKQDNRNSKRR